jgi:DUF438 domain-containing protein
MSELIDNRARRVRELKSVIERLHGGRDPEKAKHDLVQIVGQTNTSEIVSMEQELMAEGMSVQEIQSMCDLHAQVVRESMTPPPARLVPAGHPVDTFRRENEALTEAIAEMRRAGGDRMRLREGFNKLMDVEKHYQRKEHAFFAAMERRGITGPPKVMWGKDDEIRASLKRLGAALAGGEDAGELAEAALRAVEGMIYKEDNILMPMCLDAFTEEDWAEIWAASPRYGWCLVEPREGYGPAEERSEPLTGSLSPEQLAGIFSTLPLDLTFVDAEDRVAFFSEGPDSVFARSRAILGRQVQFCHPPKSVDTVNRILADFREGRQNVAEFWIDFQGRFVHIRYFAVRDAEGKYLGTLETTQDLTPLRALEGERRLLQYEQEKN